MTEYPAWNPKNSTRIVIAIATVWPPIYIAMFMTFVGFTFFEAVQGAKQPLHVGWFLVIFPLHCLTMLDLAALMAVYIIHAVRNPALTQEMRTIWIVIIVIANMMAYPAYWWIYLRPVKT